MRISTNEFLLGSLNDMLAQQSTVNQLNREIATGQTMLDASSDPGGAAQMVGVTSQIAHLTYDSANGAAATQTLQSGVGALQQVTNLLVQLRQSAVAAATGTANASDRQSLIASAQTVLQQLVELGNTQGPNGAYLFSGSASSTPAFAPQPSGQVVFNGDNGSNQVEIAPSLNVTSTVSGQNIFMNVPAGAQGVGISAAGGNTGSAYAVVGGVTSLSQVTAAALAGTQYQIAFAAGPGGSLTYTVTSGAGAPGSPGFIATAGVIASGGYAAGSDAVFAGIDVKLNGSPTAGDSFTVQPGARTSLFQTVQDLIGALQMPVGTGAQSHLVAAGAAERPGRARRGADQRAVGAGDARHQPRRDPGGAGAGHHPQDQRADAAVEPAIGQPAAGAGELQRKPDRAAGGAARLRQGAEPDPVLADPAVARARAQANRGYSAAGIRDLFRHAAAACAKGLP